MGAIFNLFIQIATSLPLSALPLVCVLQRAFLASVVQDTLGLSLSLSFSTLPRSESAFLHPMQMLCRGDILLLTEMTGGVKRLCRAFEVTRAAEGPGSAQRGQRGRMVRHAFSIQREDLARLA